MIGRNRVEAGFNVGEILPKKKGHVRVEAVAIRQRRIDTGTLPSGPTISALRILRKSMRVQGRADSPRSHGGHGGFTEMDEQPGTVAP